MQKRSFLAVCFSGILSLLVAMPANAGVMDFSFTGSFAQDDDVQLFNFEVGSSSLVTLKSLSYAGGINSDGMVIAAGGFDPILAVFDSSGLLIGGNDDGLFPDVGVDPVTGSEYDTYLDLLLDVGMYTVAISQFDNFATGPNLSDGFDRVGDGNFTGDDYGTAAQAGLAFIDFDQDQRTNQWAFDILNVETAFQNSGGTVPEPASFTIFAMIGLAGFARRRQLVKS